MEARILYFLLWNIWALHSQPRSCRSYRSLENANKFIFNVKKKIKKGTFLTQIFTMCKCFNAGFKEFIRNHVIGVFSRNVKLADCSFKQMQHFQCAMNIALQWKCQYKYSIQPNVRKHSGKLTFISGLSMKLSARTWSIASSWILVIVLQVSCTIFNVCWNSLSVTYLL